VVSTGLVECYECGNTVPIDDADLIKDEPDSELDELVDLGLVDDSGEQGDFYVCQNCKRRLLDTIDDIFKELNVRWN